MITVAAASTRMKFHSPAHLRIALRVLGFAVLQSGHSQDVSLGRRDVGLPSEFDRRLASPASVAPSADDSASASDHPDLFGDQEILARPDHWDPWTLSASVTGEWQSNAALAPRHEEADFLLRQTAAARYTLKLSDAWYLDTGAAEQIVRYNEFDVLDFARFDADAGVLWISPPTWPVAFSNWVATTRVSWYRLTEVDDWGSDLFTNTAVVGGLLRSFPLHRHHSLLVSFSGEISVDATSEEARRDEYAALVAWQAQWSPRWESTLLIRTALYDYEFHDDLNLVASASLDYIIHRDCRLGLSGNWTRNSSDADVFDYDNGTLGASLRLQLRF